MATVDLVDVRPNRNIFADGRLSPPSELWASPPLAPIVDEDAFDPPEASKLSETLRSQPKLIAGTAIVAALGAAGLAYFFLASSGAKAPAETAEYPATRVESSSETQVQPAPTIAEPAPTVAEPSRGGSGVVPSPNVPASVAAEASSQPAPTAVTSQTASAAESHDDLVFLQRPGVNIRSAPSLNAPLLGTAPKGTQFTATSREGDWVQVENTRLKGWINSRFLTPEKPQ
jgi:Bacterial SH3 domain